MTKQIHESGKLFEEVQLQNILGDGKTFPDCTPKRPLHEILKDYNSNHLIAGFNLTEFIHINFNLPKAFSSEYKSNPSHSAAEHIKALWPVLTRTPDKEDGSLIPLPYPYIVPGGRFREIYYWDSYFTMLGLVKSNRHDLVEQMIKNFAHLIDSYGYIPNGNRSYFLGRSQPPFFSLMVALLGEGNKYVLIDYLPQLIKEYLFWMKGSDNLSMSTQAINRVVSMPGGEILNRYWDEHNTPRPESYKEDVELAHHSEQKPEDLYRNLRAAAESGWDFSSRWFRDDKTFASIHTTEIIPVDLNCLLYHLEKTIALAYKIKDDVTHEHYYQSLSISRASAIIRYCWSEDHKFFFDYDFVSQIHKDHFTLAATFPLFFNIASANQAKNVSEIIQTKFLKAGGLTTTLINSSQQWDAPNGWAPLQWISYQGLKNYGFNDLAEDIKYRWINSNNRVYASTGKMTEKYDVWNDHAEASGGEYPNQDGFGWTNGVYLAMV